MAEAAPECANLLEGSQATPECAILLGAAGRSVQPLCSLGEGVAGGRRRSFALGFAGGLCGLLVVGLLASGLPKSQHLRTRDISVFAEKHGKDHGKDHGKEHGEEHGEKKHAAAAARGKDHGAARKCVSALDIEKVHLGECSETADSQMWQFDNTTGLITSTKLDLCLDSHEVNGKRSLRLWFCGWSEHWRLDHKTGLIENDHGDSLCASQLEHAGGAWQMWPCEHAHATHNPEGLGSSWRRWQYKQGAPVLVDPRESSAHDKDHEDKKGAQGPPLVHIKQHVSSSCLSTGNSYPGTPQLQVCDDEAAEQKWQLENTTGLLRSIRTGLCLDSVTPSKPGSKTRLWVCSWGTGQKWHVDPKHDNLVNAQGLCLDTLAPTGGEPLLQYCDHSNTKQVFKSLKDEVPKPAKDEDEDKKAPAVAATPKTSFFCFAFIMANSTEVDLINLAAKGGLGIFACDGVAVFSHLPQKLESWRLPATLQVNTRGTWDPDCKTPWGRLCNAPNFIQTWHKVREIGLYKEHDYSIKADADTVFFPDRLVAALKKEDTSGDEATYVQNLNCWASIKLVGPLEIISRAGIQRFFTKGDACMQDNSWKTQGEDVWLNNCLDQLDVKVLDMSGILSSGNGIVNGHPDPCAYKPCSDRMRVGYHHYKSAAGWEKCYADSAL